MKNTQEEEIINKRAAELEKIGFVFKCDENRVWYEKGEVKMIPTLMMCASEREWQEFISQHKPNSDIQSNGASQRTPDSSTSVDQKDIKSRFEILRLESLLKEKEDEITQLKAALSKAQSKITELVIENEELKQK